MQSACAILSSVACPTVSYFSILCVCVFNVCVCVCVCMCGFCNVCVFEGFVMCGCFGNMYTVL